MATWILSWDDTGIEAVINWTEEQNKYVEETLRNGQAKKDLVQLINYLEMRARFNNHRCPEIYAVNIDDEMDQDQIANYFEESPAVFKDLIRTKAHYKIW